MNQGDLFIGERVAYWRKRRGKSQRVVAGLVGISQGYLSRIESGTRPVERRGMLTALAQALEVGATELTGQPGDPTEPAKARATPYLPAIRDALITREIGEETRVEPSASVRDLVNAGVAYDFAEAARMLPSMLGGLNGTEFVQACTVATYTLKHLGYADLSRDAARLSLSIARQLDEPTWIGVAEINRLISLPLELSDTAVGLAHRAAHEIQPSTGRRDVRQAYGMLHLHAALRSGVGGDDTTAMDHLDEARTVADSLGEPAGLGLCSLAFGPTNVQIWHAALLSELGDSERAAAVGEQVDVSRIGASSRRASFWVDHGRALAQLRRDEEAIAALLRAETICPQWVRLRRTVRDTIGVILRRTQRRAVSPSLQRAAQMVGLPT